MVWTPANPACLVLCESTYVWETGPVATRSVPCVLAKDAVILRNMIHHGSMNTNMSHSSLKALLLSAKARKHKPPAGSLVRTILRVWSSVLPFHGIEEHER